MKNVLLSAAIILSVAVSGCASTATSKDSGFVMKVNGVETNTERAKKVNYLIPALIVGATVGAGVLLLSGGGDSSSDQTSQEENLRNCIASGIPQRECQRIVYGT